MRTWILFQAEKVQVHLLADVRIELADVPLSSGSDFNPVCQDSISQSSQDFTEWNGPFLLSLFQSGTGVCEVLTVHLLFGQALQKAEIVDGNDRGQVLATAGDDGALLPVGGAIYDVGKLFPRFRDV